MNFSNSTTGKSESLKDKNSLDAQWESIDWLQVQKDVNRLQTRIAKATVKGDKNKVKRLQYLLTHSFCVKAYAVKKVTSNKGKNTSGVDKKLWSTSASKMKAVLALTDKRYRAKPLNIDDGFDFLGWTFRKFKGKLIVKPSKSSLKTLIRKCATIILKEGKANSQSELIRRLNQVIRGWTNYHRHVVASQAFTYINNTLYLLLQQWAKHRHPNKNNWWRLNRYWHEKSGKRWLFMTNEYSLINLRRKVIIRHPKLQISKNPFIHKTYFVKRKMKLKLLFAARNGEEMLEPYERETLTYGS